MQYCQFRTALRSVRTDLSPYTFRRTYAHWLELAQIPRSRRKLYLGHSTGDTTGDYETSEVEAFLAEDAQRLTAWMLAQWQREHAKAKMPAASLTMFGLLQARLAPHQ